jgi:hypothetical protein
MTRRTSRLSAIRKPLDAKWANRQWTAIAKNQVSDD